MTKQELRTMLKTRRASLDAQVVRDKSAQILRRLQNMEIYRQAKIVMAYCSAFGEVDTTALLADLWKRGKTVYAPVCDVQKKTAYPAEIRNMADLQVGAYGILEPKPTCPVQNPDADLIIVPGIAFDRRGGRIGFGAGYYDKLLQNIPGTKMALAYDFQIVENTLQEQHDVCMDCIVTESELIVCE